ncbi:MAG: Smr/MutS family protein [Sandaracinaceae bacterium]
MAKKKKKQAPAAAARPKNVSTSLAGLLRGVDLSKKPDPPPPKSPPRAKRGKAPLPPGPAKAVTGAAEARPSDTLRGQDKIAFHQAMNGVRPIHAAKSPSVKTPPRPAPVALDQADQEARARLGALVGGGVDFDLAYDGDRVLGRRRGLPLRLADDLSRKAVVPEATLDLHGMRGDEATREVTRWLRAEQRRGAGVVCVVTGKGLHNESGLSILRDRVVKAMTAGGAAPVVRAFGSAHRTRGGTGALMVVLER